MWHAGVRPSREIEVRCAGEAGDDIVRSEARALLQIAMGRVLRDLREARGWSQLGLACRAGVPLRAVTRLELGQQPFPALRDARPIVAALGFDAEPFINAVEYRAVVIHADAQARRSQQTRRALRALAEELRARVQGSGQVGEP